MIVHPPSGPKGHAGGRIAAFSHLWRCLRSPKGVNLLQMAIALSIIVVLVVVGIPTYEGMRSRAYITEIRNHARVWMTQALTYYMEKGSWRGASDQNVDWVNPPSRYWQFGPHVYGPEGYPQEAWFVAQLNPAFAREMGWAHAQAQEPGYMIIFTPTRASVECGALLAKSCDRSVEDAPPAPPTPQGVRVLATFSSTITVGWDDVAGETNYVFQWREQGGGGWQASSSLPADTTSYTVTELAPATTYDLRVIAINDAGPATSTTIQGTTLPNPPPAPTGLSVSGQTQTALTLSWGDVAGETAYVVEWRVLGGGGWSQSSSLSANTTSYTVTGLAAGTTYELRVVASNSGGSNTSSITTGTTLPTAPTGMAVTGTTQTTISVSWTDATGESSYAVRWRPEGGGWQASSSLSANTISYTITGLAPATTHDLLVEALSAGGGAMSSIIQGTTLPNPPPAPTGLSVSGQTQTALTLSWGDVAGETAYVVEWRISPGSWSQSSSLPANTTSRTVTGLAAGTTYELRVIASNSGGSNTSSITTGTTLPTAPTGLAVTGTTQTTISVSWTDATGESSYVVRWRPEGGGWQASSSLSANTTSYTITGLAPATTHDLLVEALSTGGGAMSSIIQGTTLPNPPPAPTGLSVSGQTQTALTLSWGDVTGETAYVVEWRVQGAGSWTQSPSLPANTTSRTVTGLTAGTTYELRVIASNSGGSNTSSITTAATLPNPPPAPTGLSVSGQTQTALTLSWGDVAGETAYVVEWRIVMIPNPGSWVQSSSLPANTTSYTVTGLIPGNPYELRVIASNSGGSSTSSIVSGETLPNPPPAPTGLLVTGWTQTALTLSWGDVAGETAYRVEWRVFGGGGWSQSSSLSANTTSYTVTGLTAGTTYELRVVASNLGGSTTSSIITGTTPTVAPTNFRTTGQGYTWISVAWNDVIGEAGYQVAWRVKGTSTWTLGPNLSANTVSYTTPSVLSEGTPYELRVRAFNAGGESWSPIIEVWTPVWVEPPCPGGC